MTTSTYEHAQLSVPDREQRLLAAVPSLPYILSVVLAGFFLWVLVAIPSWSSSLVLLVALLIAIVPSIAQSSMHARLVVFFVLLAASDFVKRLTFLVPDQAVWSQYAVFLFPYAYYGVFILWPHMACQRKRPISRFALLAISFICVAALNTWIAPDFSVLSKLTATALLILPWTMLLVGEAHAGALNRVASALVYMGVLSALYGLVHFFFGPTTVELRWAAAVSGLSIGATRLATFLDGPAAEWDLWRASGLQADALTFGLFLTTSLACCWLLHNRRRLRTGAALVVTVVLASAIAACLVRTVWISVLAMAGFIYLSRRIRLLSGPRAFTTLAVVLFVLADSAATSLRSHAESVAVVSNPYLARALVLGTVEARKNALANFEELLPKRLLGGSGYASSTWIGGKFGADQDSLRSLVSLTSHNVVLELLYFVGLPGLLLFFALFYELARNAFRAVSRSVSRKRTLMTILTGYVLGMFVSGLGNGGVFLGFYFFYLCGVTAGYTGTERFKYGEHRGLREMRQAGQRVASE